MINTPVIVVGSNSIHTKRFINGITPSCNKLLFITNSNEHLDLADNIEVHTIDFKIINMKARKQIANIIKNYPNATIHIHQANSYAYHTLKAIKLTKLKYKVILTTWGSDVLILPQKNKILKRMVQFNLTGCDIITSDSLFMSLKIKELAPLAQKIHTINFGIQNFPQQLDLSKKENIILSNRLHKPLYNIDKIIEAFAKITDPSYKLVIIASGSETDKLKQLCNALNINNDKVLFTGMLSYTELLEWYKKAKFFVSVPSSDATSLSLLEAMGYGCYPILSNLPANLEWVLDGINGIINQSSDSLYLDLNQALNVSPEKLSEANFFNYQLIKEKAVFEDNIQKFLALY